MEPIAILEKGKIHLFSQNLIKDMCLTRVDTQISKGSSLVLSCSILKKLIKLLAIDLGERV